MVSLKDKIEYKWLEVEEEPYKTSYNYHKEQFHCLNDKIVEDVKESINQDNVDIDKLFSKIILLTNNELIKSIIFDYIKKRYNNFGDFKK